MYHQDGKSNKAKDSPRKHNAEKLKRLTAK